MHYLVVLAWDTPAGFASMWCTLLVVLAWDTPGDSAVGDIPVYTTLKSNHRKFYKETWHHYHIDCGYVLHKLELDQSDSLYLCNAYAQWFKNHCFINIIIIILHNNLIHAFFIKMCAKLSSQKTNKNIKLTSVGLINRSFASSRPWSLSLPIKGNLTAINWQSNVKSKNAEIWLKVVHS